MVSQLKPRQTKPKRHKREPVVSVARITSKGQITLPKAVREHFGLAPGDEIAFVQDENGTHVRRRLREDPLTKWVGFIKDLEGADVDAMIDEMRGR